MSELARLRLARASRNWFSGSELVCSADAYVRRLNEQGYASRTSNIYLESVAHFAHWSARRHIGLAGINEAAVERFLKHFAPLPLRPPLPADATQWSGCPGTSTRSPTL